MIILITGGSRSGKSVYAERLLKEHDDTVYIATAEITDDEMQARVAAHIARRNSKWRTYEQYRNLKNAVGCEKFYLLDCVTNLISRTLFDLTKSAQSVTARDMQNVIDASMRELRSLIDAVKKINGTLIIVTNEVGSSIVPMESVSRCFSDAQGIVNAELAKVADRVFLTVCGIPIRIK